MKQIEREIKYRITEEDYRKAVNGYDCVTQINHYFVQGKTIDKYVLRIRNKTNNYELTLKIKNENSEDVFVSDEYNYPINKVLAEKFIAHGIGADVINSYFGLKLPLDMQFNYIGYLKTLRTKIDIYGFLFEFDKNSYLGLIDYEVECECDKENIEIAKKYLQNNYEVSQSQPKIIRFFNKLKNM